MAIDATRGIDVLHSDFNRRHENLAPSALRAAERVGDPNLIGRTGRLLRESRARHMQAERDGSGTRQKLAAFVAY
jgi:hypothetical protein